MDGLELRRKRALYRAVHRGTKELDIILGRFAEVSVLQMDEGRLAAFEQLLAAQDPDIDLWVRRSGAPDGIAGMVAEIRAFWRIES